MSHAIRRFCKVLVSTDNTDSRRPMTGQYFWIKGGKAQ